MEKLAGQQVYDEDVLKNWRQEFRDTWLDCIGTEFGAHLAMWAEHATNAELWRMANICLALRFNEQ